MEGARGWTARAAATKEKRSTGAVVRDCADACIRRFVSEQATGLASICARGAESRHESHCDSTMLMPLPVSSMPLQLRLPACVPTVAAAGERAAIRRAESDWQRDSLRCVDDDSMLPVSESSRHGGCSRRWMDGQRDERFHTPFDWCDRTRRSAAAGGGGGGSSQATRGDRWRSCADQPSVARHPERGFRSNRIEIAWDGDAEAESGCSHERVARRTGACSSFGPATRTAPPNAGSATDRRRSDRKERKREKQQTRAGSKEIQRE